MLQQCGFEGIWSSFAVFLGDLFVWSNILKQVLDLFVDFLRITTRIVEVTRLNTVR